MAAPSYIAASTGATDAGGAWTATCHAPGAAGRLIILQVLQDGATSGAVTFTSATNIENLAGTDNQMTYVGEFAVGSATAALQHVWIGRSLSTSAPTFTGGNSTSEDVYWRFYEFDGVNTGTALTDVIENAALAVTGTCSLGASHGPDGICIDSANAYVYVANQTANTVEQVRISDMTVTGTCSLGASHTPRSVCIDSADAYVYVSNNAANTVEQVRISDMTVTGTCSLGATHGPRGVCIDSADAYVYVANYDANTVEQVRISDMTVTGTCSVGASHSPHGVCIDSADAYVYVSNNAANTVEQVRISDMTVTGTCSLDASHGPYGVCIDSADAYVYVANSVASTVEQIRVSDMTVTGTCSLGANHSPQNVCIDSVDAYVYVANYASTVEQIRVSDMTVTSTGWSAAPTGICIDSADAYVYVTNFLVHTIQQIDLTRGAGDTSWAAGTNATVTAADVTTLASDRLGIQLVGINDDNAIAAFTGETGGDWTEAVAEYADAGGTDGSIGLQTSAAATAGTISGGTFTQADANDGWGVVGFALKPQPEAAEYLRRGANWQDAVSHSNVW